MSQLSSKVVEDMKTAMRAKDSVALNVLRNMKSAFKYAAIEKYGVEGELDEAEAVAVIRKQIKQREDSMNQFRNAKREDLASHEEAEIAILKRYIPASLSEEEVEALVDAAIAEMGATEKKQMGAVVKLVQERANGRTDGKTVSQIVGRKLK